MPSGRQDRWQRSSGFGCQDEREASGGWICAVSDMGSGLAFCSTSFFASELAPVISPIQPGRNGSACLRSAANKPSELSCCFSASSWASRSPTPARWISCTTKLKSPRLFQKLACAYITTWSPAAKLRFAAFQITIEVVAAAFRSFTVANTWPRRRFHLVISPSNQMGGS